MDIKDKVILNKMIWSTAEDIEYNNICAFQTSYNNTPGYCIFRWTGNAYTLQEQYTCHVFDPPVIILEGELVCTFKFMTPIRKNSYWYHDPDESIPFMLNLKQVVMPYIELIQENNTTNKLSSLFKEYDDKKHHLLSVHDHQII